MRQVLEHFFQMPDQMLRGMIEDLIKRDYLERDEDQMNTFRYRS